MDSIDPVRRALLKRMAMLAGVVAMPLPFSACRSSCAPTPSVDKAVTFDAHEWSVIEAVTARIIPTDDLPGAKEANAVGYIDRQLAEPHFEVFKREFEAGVSALDYLSAARFGARFLEVSGEQQDEVLAALEVGEGSAAGFSGDHFFVVLFTLTLEGTFGDPIHGGNRNEAGWKIIGYAPGNPRPSKGDHHG